MCFCSKSNRKALKLNEILEELDKWSDDEVFGTIYIAPPDNANANVTDEDSGDEDNVGLNNLPGGQLRAEAEIRHFDINDYESDDDSDDNIPLASLVKRKRVAEPRPTKKKCVNKWQQSDMVPSLPPWELFQECQQNPDPMDIFMKLFDDNIFTLLVEYTNMYAVSHNRSGDVTPDEMRCFVGVLLLSGYVRVPRREMYWENAKDVTNEVISKAMPRNRFRFIMQNIHCCDNTKLQQQDRFAKVRPLFDAIGKNFILHAPLEEFHSIDESMVPYFGHHGTKQFIRGKPIRWGYKFWAGTTRLGYILWFEPYQGASTPLDDKYKHLGLGASVVLQFVDVLQDRFPYVPFEIYFDNFFTSIKLLEELKLRNVKAVGTMRENRVGKDCPLQHSKALKRKDRGFFEYATTIGNSVVVCKWVDNSIVTIASNNCEVLPSLPVSRYSQKDKKKITIQQPKLIKMYNENMGGVDRADQNIGLYRTSIRGKNCIFRSSLIV